MKCTNCAQASDWGSERGDWSPVHPGEDGVRRLFECDVCGNRQLNR